ncbi:hypothetical protein OXIME_001104 [Oxyplasma meridianum]|uniref:Lycopene cyclase domain-containing protein n=1 Tax=Oxyplasma meridianum TaxID=3073602 RepID=A0AAX4NI28_9ARCH
MKNNSFLSFLLFADAVILVLGGYILRINNLVPFFLTVATYASVVFILAVAYSVLAGNKRAQFLGFILGFVAVAISTNPEHISALMEFGSTVPLSEADITMILGFYVLPIIYIVKYATTFFTARKAQTTSH